MRYILYTSVVCVQLHVSVCLFNGSVQAESYLLFHKGPDFPPRGVKRHIRCHYRELNCLCGERDEQNDLSVCLSVSIFLLICTFLLTYIYTHTYIYYILTVIRAKISGEKIVSPSNNSSPYMKMIQYEIKMIKVRSFHTCYFCSVLWDRHILTGSTNPPAILYKTYLWIIFDRHFFFTSRTNIWCYFLFCSYMSLVRCLKALTKPRISSMCTPLSSPRCAASNWTTTIKRGICSQVSVCNIFDVRKGKKQTKCSFVHLYFWQEQTAVKDICFPWGVYFFR